MKHQLRIIETGTYSGGETSVLTRAKTQLKRPSMYKVILMNDDYTPMDFVVYVLEQFFSKSSEEAIQLMLNVHNKGSAVCGVFTYEIAEAKLIAVLECATEHGHPLECTIEKE